LSKNSKNKILNYVDLYCMLILGNTKQEFIKVIVNIIEQEIIFEELNVYGF